MNMRSHLALAVYLSERLDLRSFAFIFGNVQPDLAVYSYLKGSTSGRKAHGHDYRNMLPRIVSVLSKLEQGKGEGIVHSYRLGKLMHYIADSFTFPHNEIFRGSLRAHIHYEDDLEIVLLNHLNEDYFQTTLFSSAVDGEWKLLVGTEFRHQPGKFPDSMEFLKGQAMVYNLVYDSSDLDQWIVANAFANYINEKTGLKVKAVADSGSYQNEILIGSVNRTIVDQMKRYMIPVSIRLTGLTRGFLPFLTLNKIYRFVTNRRCEKRRFFICGNNCCLSGAY